MCELKKRVEEALFEARPYLEYFDELKDTIEKLLAESGSADEFRMLLDKEIENAVEPFRTDLRIFLQKFEGL